MDGEIKGHRIGQSRTRARKIIENFMIAANVEMAEFLESTRLAVDTPRRQNSGTLGRHSRIAAEYGAQLA